MSTSTTKTPGTWLLTLILLLGGFALAHANGSDIVMYLEIGTLSEIIIPEPYTTVQIPVQIIEMRDVPGRNKRVITVHPIVPQKTKTNIRVYTQHYDFNIRIFLNWTGTRTTESLDLGKFAQKITPWKDTAAPNGIVDNGAKTRNGASGNGSDIQPDRPATFGDFSFKKLYKVRPDLLKPNKHAPAMVKNRVVFAIDHIFHHKGKLVFKATLWNKSKVPYNILQLTVTYKEKVGIPVLNQHESKSLILAPFYEKYSRKIVAPGKKSHIIYVTSKLSPQDTGFFNCVLVEKFGTRNFDFNIPSYIK
ncbi:MAG: DUF4138 domain-containing protein [bacterium]